MKVLQERFEKAFDNQNFTDLEIVGFTKNPKLAFVAGACIGANIVSEEYSKQINSIREVVSRKLSEFTKDTD